MPPKKKAPKQQEGREPKARRKEGTETPPQISAPLGKDASEMHPSMQPPSRCVEGEQCRQEISHEEDLCETLTGQAEINEEGYAEGEDGSEASASVTATKKSKMFTGLSPQQEEEMVEWLQVNPVIYNRKLAGYKDTQKKNLLWKDKADAMGKSDVMLTTWYKSIRSRYGRVLKKKSGDGATELTERDLWIKSKFDFLKIHIYEVPRRTVASLTSKIAAAETASASVDLSDAEDDCAIQPSRAPTPVPTSTIQSKTKARKGGEDDVLLASISERSSQALQIQEKILSLMKPTTSPSERQAFVDWIRSVTMELEQDVWRKFQVEMCGLIWKFLGENDLSKEMQMTAPPDPVPPQPVSFRYGTPTMFQQPPAAPTQHQTASPWQPQSFQWMQQQQPQHHITQLHSRATDSPVPFSSRPLWETFPTSTSTGEGINRVTFTRSTLATTATTTPNPTSENAQSPAVNPSLSTMSSVGSSFLDN